MRGRVLVIAGSDSGGGAGIQADIKTITALDGFAMTAVTAVTAQNTLGVQGVHPVPLDFLRLQIDCVLADLGADAIKTGMLGDAGHVALVIEALRGLAPATPVVVDPVMVAKGGAALLAGGAVAVMREGLLPLAQLLTPNVPEAEVLTGRTIGTEAEMVAAGQALLAMGARAVLMKGGHLAGEAAVDFLVTGEGVTVFRARRIATVHTHGTGCTLASACAAGLAQGMTLVDAVRRAHAFVQAAIAAAPGYGGGHGPLNHAVTVDTSRLGG